MFYADTDDTTNIVKYSQISDVAIVFVACTSSEGFDRKTLSLSEKDNKLIKMVNSLQKKK